MLYSTDELDRFSDMITFAQERLVKAQGSIASGNVEAALSHLSGIKYDLKEFEDLLWDQDRRYSKAIAIAAAASGTTLTISDDDDDDF